MRGSTKIVFNSYLHLHFNLLKTEFYFQFASWENADLLTDFELMLRVTATLRNMKQDFGLSKAKPDGKMGE